MPRTVRLEVDTTAGAAYITIGDGPVDRTVELTPSVLVDLDRFGVAVGIEILDMHAEIPMQRLMSEFHVHSETADAVTRVRPSVSGFLATFSSADGVSRASSDSDMPVSA